MPRLTRRTFFNQTLATAATVTIAGTKSSGKVLGANDTIRIAVAGLNGRGGDHVDEFGDPRSCKNVEIVYLVDPDKRTYKKRIRSTRRKLGRPASRRRSPTSARCSKTRNSTRSRSRRRTTGTA